MRLLLALLLLAGCNKPVVTVQAPDLRPVIYEQELQTYEDGSKCASIELPLIQKVQAEIDASQLDAAHEDLKALHSFDQVCTGRYIL